MCTEPDGRRRTCIILPADPASRRQAAVSPERRRGDKPRLHVAVPKLRVSSCDQILHTGVPHGSVQLRHYGSSSAIAVATRRADSRLAICWGPAREWRGLVFRRTIFCADRAIGRVVPRVRVLDDRRVERIKVGVSMRNWTRSAPANFCGAGPHIGCLQRLVASRAPAVDFGYETHFCGPRRSSRRFTAGSAASGQEGAGTTLDVASIEDIVSRTPSESDYLRAFIFYVNSDAFIRTSEFGRALNGLSSVISRREDQWLYTITVDEACPISLYKVQ
jgi:hypothetical protein